MNGYFLIVLAMIGCLHPIFVLTNLWQRKEWRWDRLWMHVKEYGFFWQIIGWIRPSIVIVMFGITRVVPNVPFLESSLAALAGLSILQMFTSTHRPQWTKKVMAILLLTGSINLACAQISLQTNAKTLVLFPLLQFLPILLAYLLLLPLDTFFKKRILQQAHRLRTAHPNLTVIGITGSVGKTTTKECLLHLLKDRGAVATPLHVNTELGVASWLIETLKDLPSTTEKILIVEMGAYKKGEIALMCSYVAPTIGIITSIGEQHLGLFGSREAILQAKGELFAALPKNGLAIGNADQDNSFAALKKLARCRLLGVSTGRSADITAKNIEETREGLHFAIDGTAFSTKLSGTHNITNILLAIAAAQFCGSSMEHIKERIKSFQNLHGTFEITSIQGVTILNDTYNSGPQSALAGIHWAQKQEYSRKILVLAPLLELGKETKHWHTTILENASTVFDVMYVLEPRMLSDLQPLPENIFLFSSLQEIQVAKQGDLLVCIGRMPQTTIHRFLQRA